MMRKFAIFVAFSCFVLISACSKEAKVDEFIAEFNSANKEIVSTIEASPNAAGMDKAQRAFDNKKISLNAKLDEIKGANSFEIGAAARKRLDDTMAAGRNAVLEAAGKNTADIASDPQAVEKYRKLMADYTATFAPPAK